mmetsp:Transcript_22672/g.71091  ORF Transcript_22672/g.71091 Transcript_22672/m.71091 type:complete len:361 (-) Transcript_22672:331-1413(-)
MRVARVARRAVDDVRVVRGEPDVLDAVEVVEPLDVDHVLGEGAALDAVVLGPARVVQVQEGRRVADRRAVGPLSPALVAVPHVEADERLALWQDGHGLVDGLQNVRLGPEEPADELRDPPEVAPVRVVRRRVLAASKRRRVLVPLVLVGDPVALRRRLEELPERPTGRRELVVLDVIRLALVERPREPERQNLQNAAEAHASDARLRARVGALRDVVLELVEPFSKFFGVRVRRRPRRVARRHVLPEAHELVGVVLRDARHARRAGGVRGDAALEREHARRVDARAPEAPLDAHRGPAVAADRTVRRPRRRVLGLEVLAALRGPEPLAGREARERPRARLEAAFRVARLRPARLLLGERH